MVGWPLHVQQSEAGVTKDVHKSDQGHLGCVTLSVEHGFTGEETAYGYAVKATNQRALAADPPHFDTVCPPEFVQTAVGLDNGAIDPPMLARCISAPEDYVVETLINSDLKVAT